MSILDRWFGQQATAVNEPDIRFGRFSDSYKSIAAYDAWDEALDCYDKGQYLDSMAALLQFLRDDNEDNVHWQQAVDRLSFECYQGSKRVVGWATPQRFRAEARVARLTEYRPELLRRFLEHNFTLKFCRYALDPDDYICVTFDSLAVEASPYKVYYALKELATQADKQDDILLEEFDSLQDVDNSHTQPLPEDEALVKCQYLRQQIQDVLAVAEQSTLSPKEYPGAYAYLYLNLLYKLDYLIKPEGYTLDTLERVHRRYFMKEENVGPYEKNQWLEAELRQLQQRSEQDYRREMYRIKSTFGITTPVTHDRLRDIIEAELPNMDWYKEQGHHAIAQAVPGYIIGYCLFNYAVPEPDRALFHLHYQITEAAYFRALGFQQQFVDLDKGVLDKKAIKKALQAIGQRFRPRYPKFHPEAGRLEMDNLTNFTKTYLEMIAFLDLTRLD